jgi:2,4-diketo-3-deoxy-L-fuconate hydrolase
MKLIRFGEAGKEKPGVHIDGKNYDVSGFIKDYDESFFANGGLQHLGWMLSQHENMLRLLPEGTRLGCPVANPSKILCIGLNYAIHAKETNARYQKNPSCS